MSACLVHADKIAGTYNSSCKGWIVGYARHIGGDPARSRQNFLWGVRETQAFQREARHKIAKRSPSARKLLGAFRAERPYEVLLCIGGR